MRSLIRAASLGCLLVFWAIGAKAQTGITLGTPTAVTGASDPTYSEACPSWSPDDKWLVFCSNQYGNNDIFKVDMTTGIVTRLTTNAAPESFPSWSPDGQKILFQRSVGSTSEIWIMNQDGTGQQRLTSGYRDGEASFSPDGSRILFAGWRSPASDYGIFTMNPDGSAVTWLNVLGAHPKWSRDGTRIAFERYNQFGVWVMNADGTGLHACSPRTNNSNDGGGGIDWSPSDCGYLVYTVNPSYGSAGTNSGLAVINSASCSGQNQILPFGSGSAHPAWSHDGAKLAFYKFDGYQGDIYLAEIQGCKLPIPVSLDIKPGSCPNPLNVKLTQVNGDGGNVNSAASKIAPGSVNNEAAVGGKGRAVLPVAILGSENFDVADIDISSIMLQGVAPIRWSFEDVSTPDPIEIDACACNTIGPDGYIDLTLKFDKDQIAATLSDIAVGDTIPLIITGQTKDGDAFEGTDCVVIVGNDNALVSTDSFESDASQMKFEGTVESPTLPIEFALIGNHPNPFNPTTTIDFSLTKASEVQLEVFNIAGQKVATLVSTRLEAGYHSVTWDSRNNDSEPLASGIYLYRLKADTFVETKKMMLLK